ncbi:MAG: hypothetical protein ACRDRH_23820 [Pseudonocardia sp.]
MDVASATGDGEQLFVANKWRYSCHTGSGMCFLLDAESDYLSLVPEPMIRIAGNVALHPDADLRTAATTWAAVIDDHLPKPPKTALPELRLRLLGARILVRFTHDECLRGVARYFSCSHDDSACSPDVVVHCDWPQAGRYLFRARPAEADGVPLGGVQVQAYGENGIRTWVSMHPPLPPLALPPFRDRFAALHGAVVRRPDGGGALILGERDAGKSSCAIELSRQPGVEVLSDETAFVHLRTAIAEPFPQSVGVWSGGRKVAKPAAEVFPQVADRPAVIDHVALLHPQRTVGEDHMGIFEISPVEVLRALMPHLRDVCSSLDEVILTLDHIVRSTRAVNVRFGDRAEMLQLIPAAIGLSDAEARN